MLLSLIPHQACHTPTWKAGSTPPPHRIYRALTQRAGRSGLDGVQSVGSPGRRTSRLPLLTGQTGAGIAISGSAWVTAPSPSRMPRPS